MLEEAEIVERTIDVFFLLTFEYADMNKVMRIIKENNIDVHEHNMELNCNYKISIRKKYADKVEQYFLDLRCLKIKRLTK